MADWKKLVRPQFVVLLVFLVLLVAAENSGLRLPTDLKVAMSAAVIAWIAGETAVDARKVG